MTINRALRRGVAAATATMLLAAMLVATGAPAQAASNQDMTRSYINTFYAYVRQGEALRVSTTDAASVVITDEAGKNVPATVDGLTAKVASGTGVWQVKIAHKTGVLGFDYDINVRAAARDIPGRVWVYSDAFRQRAMSSLEYFGVSDQGYVYQINMSNMIGVDAKIALRSSGASPTKNCDAVTNKSFDNTSAYMDCGDNYRLFFENPINAGLPAEAKMGNTTIPVLPGIVSSSQLQASTRVSFAPNADKVGGSFTAVSHVGFSGTAEIQVDTNGNGSYADAVDVKQQIVVNKGKADPWVWNGKNANGAEVVNGGNARVVITKGAEAHLLMHDIEELGGLTMRRLNGASPNATMYWDDSALVAPRGGTPTKVKVCTQGCNSGVAGGVHGWDRGVAVGGTETTSWGDGRIINNWAYVALNATSPAIALPALRTMTFNATGGALKGAATIKRSNGLAWGTLPTATATAKVFLGWGTAVTGGTPITAATLATSSLTAYAQWRPARFNVAFDGNGETGVITGSTASMSYDSGCTDCRLPANGFTKTTGAPALVDHEDEQVELNSRFLGWSLDPRSRIGDIADLAVAGGLSVTDGATVRLYAVWDDAPQFVIGSYPDREFNLAQAQAGEITEDALLSTVRATDRETKPLATKTSAQEAATGNDVGITLHDYAAADFTSLTATGAVTVTYKVKDEANHVAFLRIRVSVADDSPIAPTSEQYLRGVSPDYSGKPAAQGGFPGASLWLTDPTRQEALNRAMTGGSGRTYCLDAEEVGALRDQAEKALGSSGDPAGLSLAAGVLRDSGACS